MSDLGRRQMESTIETLTEEVDRLRAERDALLPVVEAAKAWRESLNLVEQIDASDEEHALADALGMPIRVTFPLAEPHRRSPAVSETRQKTELVGVRLTQSDYVELQRLADRSGQTLPAMFRDSILATEQLRAERDDLRKTIRRLGDALHATEAIVAERDALLAVYDAMREELCNLCASGICSAHQPGAGIIDALQPTEGTQL